MEAWELTKFRPLALLNTAIWMGTLPTPSTWITPLSGNPRFQHPGSVVFKPYRHAGEDRAHAVAAVIRTALVQADGKRQMIQPAAQLEVQVEDDSRGPFHLVVVELDEAAPGERFAVGGIAGWQD